MSWKLGTVELKTDRWGKDSMMMILLQFHDIRRNVEGKLAGRACGDKDRDCSVSFSVWFVVVIGFG